MGKRTEHYCVGLTHTLNMAKKQRGGVSLLTSSFSPCCSPSSAPGLFLLTSPSLPLISGPVRYSRTFRLLKMANSSSQ